MAAKRHERVRLGMAILEIEATSLLLHHWAEERDDIARPAAWNKRLPVLRKAVLKGLGKPRPGPRSEKVPPELIHDEYRVLLPVVKAMCKECRGKGRERTERRLREWSHEIGIGGGETTIKRPCPVPKAELASTIPMMITTVSNRPNEIAKQLVAMRFGDLKDHTVRSAIGDKRNREKARGKELMLLASIFLDYCSFPRTNETLFLQAEILDALVIGGYPKRMLYYLVKRGHMVPDEIAVDLCGEKDVRLLCNHVMRTQAGKKRGPFLSLLQNGPHSRG